MLRLMNSSIMLLMFFFMIMYFSYDVIKYNYIYIMSFCLYSMNTMSFDIVIIYDFKSSIFICLITFITSMIFFYSMSYMNLKKKFMIKRFHNLMILFLISMYFLILGYNMLTIFIGWDGLGLISYCLIIFYQNKNSYNAGLFTIILNRLGDSALLILSSMMMMYGNWNLFFFKMNSIMMFLIVLMIFTKSAQIPFSSWLTKAMMAPTPVSALVHSSTLVTAGIYLMIRYNEMLNLNFKMMILFISSMTMLISGIMANFELDIKKIIAYSTLSQLGFMISILSLNLEDLAFLHLCIHAMFKSLMFMCVGSYIHYLYDNQNIKFYTGMFYIYPMKSIIFIFSLMSLMGFPFLVGFYSKDLMIEYLIFNKMNLLSNFNLMIGTILTISYSFRIITILLNKNLYFNLIYKYEDNLMNFSMMFLMIMSIFMSKYLFNIMFLLENLILNNLMKMLIFKMFLLGYLLNYYLLNNFIFKTKLLIFILNFIDLNLIYNKIYLKPLIMINLYEIILEKTLIEMISSKFMKLYINFNFYKKINFKNLINYYIMIILMLIIMIKMI